jgi:uncharacterized protein
MEVLVVLGNSRVPAAATIDSGPAPLLHLLPGDPPLVLVIDGSRLFETTPEFFEALRSDTDGAQRELLDLVRVVSREPAQSTVPPPTAISLNIAQSCNLSCSYCYADGGRFGGHAAMMPQPVARAAIDQLMVKARGQRVTIGFIGGEPFLNRGLLTWAVKYSVARARESGSRVGFSVTTNGTLLTLEDLDFLRTHSFAISVSLDGSAEVNDHERHARGKSSFELAVQRLGPLLQDPGNARITARATVTRRDLRVLERVESLLAAGFREVGVSPLRTSPVGGLALEERDWPVFLDQMVRAAEAESEQLQREGKLRFSNLAIALKQLHAGYCKPLPCGSAASYVSVSARGEYFTCHRTVDDPRYILGNTEHGLSSGMRENFLRARHVDRQEPCRSCWARYLCGGGCHAEVLSVGRSGCDYIRGWLEYCIRFYNRALKEFPALFQDQNQPSKNQQSQSEQSQNQQSENQL